MQNLPTTIPTERYIGIPYVVNGRDFNGIDCWGLVHLVYKEELGIDLPSFVEEGINPERTQELIAQYREGWEPSETISVGDVVIFRVMGVEAHIAIAISSTHFLHARNGFNSAIESFESHKWKTRLVGIYKYSPVNSVVLNGIPHPLRTERITTAIPSGTNIIQLEDWIIKQYKIQPELKPYIRVLVNGKPIVDELKSSTILQDNDCIEYRVVPQGGGGGILNTILTVAVVVAVGYATGGTALAAGGFTGGLGWGATVGSTLGIGTLAGSMLTTMALTAVGMALVDAIAPVRIPDMSTNMGGSPENPESAEAQIMVTGGSNKSSPYGNIPFILGRIRATPPLGSNSYSLFSGERDSYLRMLLVWGYGPLYIDETSFNIGELPLSNYEGVYQETLNRISEPTAAEVTSFNSVYGNDITQVVQNVELTCDGTSGEFLTGPWLDAASSDGQTNDFTVAIHFPQGCRKIASKGENGGKSYVASVVLEIQWKPISSGNWYNLGLFSIAQDAPKKDAFTFTQTFGAYSTEDIQVRVRRRTGTGNTAPVDENYQWLFQSVLLNVTFSRNVKPAIDPVGVKIAKTAFQIKASGQLNNQIKGINAIVQTWGKSWNGSIWVDAAINNPAALFRHVLEHPANPRRVTDPATKINLTQIQYWHEYCTAKGFTFNSVVASTRSVLEVLRDICAAGRASPAMVDGKWTVVIDEEKPNIVQHFSPHNSWGFEGTKTLPKIPDGLRVTFINENKDYQEDELIVYTPGKSIANASLLESISVPGVTTLASAKDHARWHMAQAKLRPETYTINTDIEYIVCNRGDRVKIMHDVAMWGLGSGRIKNKVLNNVFELTEDVPIDFGQTYGIRFRAKNGATSSTTVVQTFAVLSSTRVSNTVTLELDGYGNPLQIGDLVSINLTNTAYNTIAKIIDSDLNSVKYTLVGTDIAFESTSQGTINLTDGYYSKIRVYNYLVDSEADTDDLFLYGTVNQEAQDCIVLAIEPTNNKSARITLVDYGVTPSYNIFTDYLNYTETVSFESQISLPPKLLIQSFGTKLPNITGFISDERVMDRIAPGVFAYKMRVSYTNAASLPAATNYVEFQWDYALAEEGNYLGVRSALIPYNVGSITITDVDEGESFKARCRYVGTDGRTGQWTPWNSHTIVGKTSPPSNVTNFTIVPQTITGKLKVSWDSNTEVDIKGYEVRTDTLWGSTINQIFLGEATSCIAEPLSVGQTITLYIRAADYSNNYSVVPSTASFAATAIPNLTSVTHTFSDTSLTLATVTLNWVDAIPQFGLKGYEVTYGTTTVIISSNSITADANWSGIRSFIIRTIDTNGQFSTGFIYNITKTSPSAPTVHSFGVNLATLNLDWDAAVKGSLPIWGYEVRTNTGFGSTGYVFKGAASICTIPNDLINVGTNTFYIKSIDTDNEYSSAYLTASYVKAAPINITTATHVFTDTSLTDATVTLDWNEVVPTFGLSYYEITYDAVVKTTKASFITLPADWVGNRTFNIKVVDLQGAYSSGFNYIVAKTAPSAPTVHSFGVNLATLNLDWNTAVKGSLPIWGYEVRTDLLFGTPGSVFKGASSVCTIPNDLITVGTNTFYIKSIDTDNKYSSSYLTASYIKAAPINITTATHVFTDTSLTDATVTLDWNEVVPTFGLNYYQVTYDAVVKTVKARSITLPADWVGNRTFNIKVVDLQGAYSSGFNYIVAKSLPAAPTVHSFNINLATLSLSWNSAIRGSLPIWGYEVRTDLLFGTSGSIFKGAASTCTIPNDLITVGTNTFYIKSIDTDNEYSSSYLTASYVKAAPINITTATHVFTDTSLTDATVTLDWNEVVPTFGLNYYQVTYGAVVKTIKARSITLPADWVGNRTFNIKVVDLQGAYSSGFNYIVAKSLPAAPTVHSFGVSQSSLVLDWNDAVKTALPIWGYEVRADLDFGTSGSIFKGAASTCIIPEVYLNLGINNFYIKSLDTDNEYSGDYLIAEYTLNPPINVTTITSQFTDTSLTAATVTLDWNDVSTEFGLNYYEITYDAIVKTSKAGTITLPANWIGDRDFVIKTVDNLGNKSTGLIHTVTKFAPSPVSNLRAQVIDNNVMLYWELPIKTSLPIDHVLLKRGLIGSTWETASTLGPKSGGFTTQNETTAGQYTYFVAAVDTDNNESVPISTTTYVSQPPDFIFFASYQSDFSGTKSSAILENGGVLLPINTTETFENHFINNGWTSPQNQVSSGYPVYIQPSTGAGYYEEIFDYGTLLASSKVSVVINGTIVTNTVNISPTISVSMNGSTWNDFTGTYEVFTTNFRYIKVRITANTNSTGIYSLLSMQVSLDSKLINDAGNVNCLSTDTLGTIVNFGKVFVDVTSVTVSPQGTTPIIPVYDFKDSVVNATYVITSNSCVVTSTAHGLITGQNIRLAFISGIAINAVYSITAYTEDTFTVTIVTPNTSGNVSAYPESMRLYLFDTVGTRVSATASWSLKGY